MAALRGCCGERTGAPPLLMRAQRVGEEEVLQGVGRLAALRRVLFGLPPGKRT